MSMPVTAVTAGAVDPVQEDQDREDRDREDLGQRDRVQGDLVPVHEIVAMTEKDAVTERVHGATPMIRRHAWKWSTKAVNGKVERTQTAVRCGRP